MNAHTEHLSFEALLDYWLHDTDPASTDAIDEHLMYCERCGAAFDEVVELGQGVRAAFRAGRIATVISAAFLGRLEHQGLRIRQYHLGHNGSVNCAVAPDDELLVARIDVPLRGVHRLDAVATLSFAPGKSFPLYDVPFDARLDQVFYVPKLADVRDHPPHDMTLTLFAHEDGGNRELGRYRFHHRRWPDR